MSMIIEVYRGATLLSKTFCPDGIISDFVVDDAPGAGSHTYTIKAGRDPQGGVGAVVGEIGFARLVLTQHKR